MSDFGFGADSFGVGVDVGLREVASHHTMLTIAKWDTAASNWASKRLGGTSVGTSGFIQPTYEDFRHLGIAPDDQVELFGNLITNAGWTRVTLMLTTGATGNQAGTGTTRIGVGTGSTGAGQASATATDMLSPTGATARFWQPIAAAATFPAANQLEWHSSFGTGDANFAWNEASTDIGAATVTTGTGASNACFFNWKTAIAQGTKASGQTWTATWTFTFT